MLEFLVDGALRETLVSPHLLPKRPWARRRISLHTAFHVQPVSIKTFTRLSICQYIASSINSTSWGLPPAALRARKNDSTTSTLRTLVSKI